MIDNPFLIHRCLKKLSHLLQIKVQLNMRIVFYRKLFQSWITLEIIQSNFQKIWSHQKIFLNFFYPINVVLKCFGLSAFSFDGPVADGKIVTTAIDLVIFLVFLCGHLSLFGLKYFSSFGDITNSFVLSKGHTATIFLSVSVAIFTMIYQFFKRQIFQNILADLHNFDVKVIDILFLK